MRYRTIRRCGKPVSMMGVGGLRLPCKIVNGREMVDDERAFPIFEEAVRLGINYFDTGWGYCNEDSQRAMGRGLKRFRSKVYLANKLPLYLTKETDDFWRYLERELERMDTGHIDFFHFHMVGRVFWKKILDLRLIEEAEKAKSKGLIDHLCFSFHDTPDLLKEMVDTGVFDSLLCQYNLVDQGNAAMMHYAHEKGMGVMVMGPNGGGSIAAGGDEFLRKYPRSPARSATELAMRFVWGNPDVDCALSGVESLEMLRENAGYAEAAQTVSREEWDYIEGVTRGALEISSLKNIYCTGCRYCDVCPLGIRPFVTIMPYSRWKIWGLENGARNAFRQIGADPWQGKDPALCIGCGKCKTYCPQHIDIPGVLKTAVAELKQLAGE